MLSRIALPALLLASIAVAAPLDVVSSVILALGSSACTSDARCSSLASLAPACYAPGLIGNTAGQSQCACTVALGNALESCALCLVQDPCYSASPRNGPLLAVQVFVSQCAPTNSAVSSISITQNANAVGTCNGATTGAPVSSGTTSGTTGSTNSGSSGTSGTASSGSGSSSGSSGSSSSGSGTSGTTGTSNSGTGTTNNSGSSGTTGTGSGAAVSAAAVAAAQSSAAAQSASIKSAASKSPSASSPAAASSPATTTSSSASAGLVSTSLPKSDASRSNVATRALILAVGALAWVV